MASTSRKSSSGQTTKGSGLLLTHDWTQLHTPNGLHDVTKVSPQKISDYQTVCFPVSSVSQYEACISGKMVCDVQGVKGCPVELELGNGSCKSCSSRPLSAIVKVTYKVTHSSPGYKKGVLCKEVISELTSILPKLLKNVKVDTAISVFLHKYGSHFELGAQTLGKAFIRMVVTEERWTDTNLLTEIAEEIFAASDDHFVSTQEGSWYSPKQLLNTSSWSQEKKQLLSSIKLRISHIGIKAKTANLAEWKNKAGDQPQILGGIGDSNIVSVWKLITNSKIQSEKKLSSAMKQGWERLMHGTKHQDIDIPYDPPAIDIPDDELHNPPATNIPDAEDSARRLVEELGMEKFFPCKLSPQNVRCLQKMQESYENKEGLVWRVLEQLMLTNTNCREQEISKYAKTLQKDSPKQKKFGEMKPKGDFKGSQPSPVPHPMDILLLLFTCSDYMLRQILACKLFMCRLAIPFIIPATPKETVEMLIWPLRSIIMEWVENEEALIKCKLNMVTFMRCGNPKVSKSKLINELLSPSGHPAFFHKGLSCGNEKRLISNGIVELSHFLPAKRPKQEDQFPEPALFFNLRGDACDHPVQHDVLMKLPTTVVILVDIGELENPLVQETFRTTLTQKKKQQLVIVLTDSKEHDEEKIEQIQNTFLELVGDRIDIEENLVTTFEMKGGQRNTCDVNIDIKDAITRKMTAESRHSVESLTKVALPQCIMDEKDNHSCSAGKKVADELLASLKKLDPSKRKEKLLPHQGDCLHKIGTLLRKLHRSSGKDPSVSSMEAIKLHIKAIRRNQSEDSNDNQFVKKVISLFDHNEKTKVFAIRWVQLELDAISRSILPELQADKNRKWNDVTTARSQKNTSGVEELERQLHQAEQKLARASCGWEHLMREVGQLYEVSLDLKKMGRLGVDVSKLPEIIGRQLLEGHPMELMDGNHGFIPIEWVKAVFRSLAKLAGQDKKIFVLSVLGIQSSGKSTLLNTMFGLEFAVSAGRCTRGIYAQLLPVAKGQNLPFDYILVLDSEGLKSQELDSHNFQHDNELATLVIGLADLALVNMKGENAREITDVLQIVVHAFLRMKLADSPHKRQCLFIHQNVSSTNAQQKLTGERQKLLEELNKMTQAASIAQGLTAETINSFNQIISFDCHRDVVYFPDLWNGNPPMANVNQLYSTQSAYTRQSILENIAANFKGFIPITDFISRVEDMWNGVLADDFIFSFRSTLAAKAYLEMEREYAKCTLQVEEKLLHFVNTDCKIQMENTRSEDELHQCHRKLGDELKQSVAVLIEENLKTLEEFFANHPACDIIVQWKPAKLVSFKCYCQKLGHQRDADLDNMKLRNLFCIRQENSAQTHEQEIIKKAISVAEKMRGQGRGKCPQEDELEKNFNELWVKWEKHLASTSSPIWIEALKDFKDILWDDKYQDMSTFFKEQQERTPLVPAESDKPILQADIVQDHIVLKEKTRPRSAFLQRNSNTKTKYMDAALKQANAILQSVMKEVEDKCRQDVMFNQLHGRYIIDHLFEEIAKHNARPIGEVAFEFTPRFKAMMAIHVARCAAPMFDDMSQQFEEKHGVHAQMQAYRRRVYLCFKNTVNNTSAEVTASEDICEALKGKMREYAKIEMEESVLRELYSTVGTTKYDLIIQMLDDFAQRENNNDTEKKNNFVTLLQYVTKPLKYAARWLEDVGNKQLFCHDNGPTKYSEVAEHIIGKMFSKIVSSTSEATRKVTTIAKTQQYSEWITAFCDNIKDTLPLNTYQLKLTTTITNFENFQKFLEKDLQRLEKEVVACFAQVDKHSVEWLHKESPYEKVVKRLWGCTALCPFCSEPCQDSDADHKSSHRCVQHRPSGIRGMRDVNSKLLEVETCNLLITGNHRHNCSGCKKQCRLTEHCNRTDEDKDGPIHPYREYKTFLPRWDIAPDPAGTASKFWQWAMCTFQKQILEQREGSNLDIPESWNDATVNDAIDSLRVFAV